MEGRKLTLRTTRGRFALPLLDLDAHPGVRSAPQSVGRLDAALLPRIAVAASAASSDDALPVFTGVHVRQDDERLVLVGTDRFRMAVVTVPWAPATSDLDLLVPAGLLGEVAKQATGDVTWHADRDRVGLSFPEAEVSTVLLAAAFPDETRHLTAEFDCTVECSADELGGAVHRVGHYAGASGAVRLEVGDSELRVHASDPQVGEAEEVLKATVGGDRATLTFQPRYLHDAVRAFAGRSVRLGLRTGTRAASVFTDADADRLGATTHYVVMPKRG